MKIHELYTKQQTQIKDQTINKMLRKRETNKHIHIFLNEHQGMKGMGNI